MKKYFSLILPAFFLVFCYQANCSSDLIEIRSTENHTAQNKQEIILSDSIFHKTDKNIWEIKNNYILDQDFTLPPNISLFFSGGTINLNGYSLKMDGSSISGHEYQYFIVTEGGDIKGICKNPLKPEWFGAIGNGNTDDTKAINVMFGMSQNNFELTGDYLVSESHIGSDHLPAAIEITNKANLTINCIGSIIFDRSSQIIPNLLLLTNCNLVNIQNLNSKEQKTILRENRTKIYTGCLVKLNNCENVKINGGRAINTAYHVMALKSTNITIVGCNSINEYPGTDIANNSYSAFILYNSKNAIISNCSVTGAYGDGTISLFGSGTKNCIVSNNILRGYISKENPNDEFQNLRIQQGITIDQGPENSLIQGNLVEGFYYGIDVKADQKHTSVISNTIKSCIVGIAERKGEAKIANFSVESLISGNTIYINKKILEAKNSTKHALKSLFSGFKLIGYLNEGRFSGHVSNNLVILDLKSTRFKTDDPPIAAFVFTSNLNKIASVYKPLLEIKNNSVVFEIGLNATVQQAPKNSVAYRLENLENFSFTGNNYSLPSSSSNSCYALELEGTIKNASFLDNTEKRNSYTSQINISKLLSHSNLYWANNSITPFSLECFSQKSQKNRHISFAGNVNLIGNKTNNIIEIKADPNRNFVLDIKATALSGNYGNMYTSADIKVNVNGSGNLTSVSKSEEFANDKLSFNVVQSGNGSVYLTLFPNGSVSSLSLDIEINSSIAISHSSAL